MSIEATENPTVWKRLLVGKSLKITAIRGALLLGVSFFIFKMVLLPIRVQGISMEPTYRDGQINFVNKLSYVRNPPQRGDIVGIRLAGESVMFLKRIVALPGDRVAIRRGILYVNGERVDEPYVQMDSPHWNHPKPGHGPETVLGPDEYFVIGDNRSMDDPDDHEHGVMDGHRIAGKVLF